MNKIFNIITVKITPVMELIACFQKVNEQKLNYKIGGLWPGHMVINDKSYV
jgi:hypothetical protein